MIEYERPIVRARYYAAVIEWLYENNMDKLQLFRIKLLFETGTQLLKFKQDFDL